MPGYDAMVKKQNQLVRKATDGSVFRAELSADRLDVATLFGADGEFTTLPTGWVDLGLLSTDGIGNSREIATSDVGAFGRTAPVRSDITTDTDTMSITAIETNLSSIELGTGATILPGARGVNGVLEIKKPPRPTAKQFQFFAVAVDGDPETGENIYICKYIPRGKITAYGDQPYTSGDEAIGWPATVTAQFDDEYGASSSWIFAGPGWNAQLALMGFTPLAP